MSEHGAVRYGNSTIAYEVVRSQRRKKTVELTIDGGAGVIVAAPVDTPCEDIAAFVRRRAAWIVRNASDPVLRAFPKRFVSGETLAYLGRRVRMVVEEAAGGAAAVRFRHWSFEVTAPGDLGPDERRERIKKELVQWYRERAAVRLNASVQRWAPIVGVKPSGVLIRDQRRRWASCAPDGTLRFNWRIVMAEPSLIDYVVVHELVHLVVQPHSREFWKRVANAIPDYEQRRRRLREIGPHLSL